MRPRVRLELSTILRKLNEVRGSFPSEEAAMKALYLALLNLTLKWKSVLDRCGSLNRFGYPISAFVFRR